MSTIINKTPHPLNLVVDGRNITIEPTLPPARVAENCKQIAILSVDGADIAVTRKDYGEIENLPEPKPDTFYVVSALVAGRVPERDDVLITSNPVRDDSGRIVGCRELAHI